MRHLFFDIKSVDCDGLKQKRGEDAIYLCFEPPYFPRLLPVWGTILEYASWVIEYAWDGMESWGSSTPP
jgi:hypothetical protein